MEAVEIAVSREQGRVPVTVFRMKGRVNLGTAEQLQAKAREVVEAGARDLLLDLTEVPSVTSAGLQAIHAIYQLLRAASPEGDEAMRTGQAGEPFKSPHLKLCHPSSDVRKVLQIAGYDLFLEIHDDMQDAVASF